MKKQLLKESEIRRMMKFANIGALSAGFVDRLNEASEMEEDLDESLAEAELEEEKLEEAVPPGAADEFGPEEAEESADVVDIDDMDVDVEEEPAVDGEMELSPEQAQVIIDLGNQLESAMGEEEEEDVDPEMDMDMDMDMDAEEDPAPPMMEEDLVNEVARRVSRRIAALRG